MTLTPDVANGLAGLASLVTSLLLVPTLISLRKIASKHEERLDGHDRDISALKATKTTKKPARKRGRRGYRGSI